MKCPTCQERNRISPDNPYRPFCSERCKLIDLANGQAEIFEIPTKERPPEEIHRSMEIVKTRTDLGCDRSSRRRRRRVRAQSAWNCRLARRRLDLSFDRRAHAGAYYLHAIIFFFIVGIWASSRVERLWGHDSQRIVIDEVVGQMITFGFAAGRYRLSAFYIASGIRTLSVVRYCEALSNSASRTSQRRSWRRRR